MATLNDAQKVGIIVTLALLIGGTYIIVTPEQTYYCEADDIVREFDRLSGSERTGYPFPATTKGKVLCSEGTWVPIKDYIDIINTEPPRIDNSIPRDHLIPSRGICIRGGDISPQNVVPIEECL